MKRKAHLLRSAFLLVLLLGVCLIPFALAQRKTWQAPANIITVTNLNDSGAGSLRQALADASDGGTINFALTGTISLTSGELVIDKSVTITGQLAITVTRASDTSEFRIFHLMPGHDVTIDGLNITGGSPALGSYGGGVFNDHSTLTISNCHVTGNGSTYGGAISNNASGGGNATLAVLNSNISANRAVFAGGGIYNEADGGGTATVSLTNCFVSSNAAAYSDNQSAVGDGGGIFNTGGALTIADSVVSNNIAGVTDPFPAGTGGGISSEGTLTITSSTISGNICYLTGGGIVGDGTLTITCSTVSGNTASSEHDGLPFGVGGGISGTVSLTNSTVSDNNAAVAGGGFDGGGVITNSTISDNNGGGISVTGGLQITNSILNASTPNISNNGGTVTSQGYNVCSDDGGGFLNGPGDQVNTNPLLGPLQDNGGPTFTHELLTGSPAIDAGNPNFTPPPYYDQRGPDFWRVRNGRIDVGSFEVQVGSTPTPTPTATATPTPTSTPTPRPTPTPRVTPIPRVRPTPASCP